MNLNNDDKKKHIVWYQSYYRRVQIIKISKNLQEISNDI